MAPPSTTVRRHPSAGNLDSRPALVADGGRPEPLNPASYPHGAAISSDLVQLGPDLDHEQLHKLIGPVENKRILDLGCGAGAAAIALARRGARVIAVESSTARLAQARAAAEIAEVKIEFHHSDLADLAFLRADAVDLVLSVYALAGVQDLGRVVRQVHRVLTPESALLLSLPHPFASMLEDDADEQQPPSLTRTAWSHAQIEFATGSADVAVYIQAVHGCCENRGIMAHSSLTQTTVLRGAFKDDQSVKKEFFDNIKLQQDFAPR